MAFQPTSRLQFDKAKLSTLQCVKFVEEKNLNRNFLGVEWPMKLKSVTNPQLLVCRQRSPQWARCWGILVEDVKHYGIAPVDTRR